MSMNRDLSELRLDGLIAREWLATNGNGAFASSTLCGLNTRKYHGLLVAAMAAPVRRMVLLSRVEESVSCNGRSVDLACNEYPGVIHPEGHKFLRAFHHEPFPRWAYQGDGWTLEKQLRPLQGENTIVISYTALGGSASVELDVRPLFALRGMHELMYQWNAPLEAQKLGKRHYRVPATSKSPEVFFAHDGSFTAQSSWYLNTIYRREQERGYAGLEDLWMPGVIRWKLAPGQTVHFICSAEPIDYARAITEAQRQFEIAVPPVLTQKPDSNLESLLRAAEQFVVKNHEGTPAVMSAYPWSAPAGRDAMICLPGLFLVTGRIEDAKQLLLRFAASLRNGLMPSEIAEDGSGYRYQAADVSLWFIHAVGEYLRYRGDELVVQRDLLPAMQQIIDTYQRGTGLGIGATEDGLLRTGVPNLPVTWMDAQVGDWVITPRSGKAVEINALWYNALRTVADLSLRFGNAARADELNATAEKVKSAFNREFWNDDAGCCFDVIDDDAIDASIRPNQIFAASLPHPVLDSARHRAVIEKLRQELLTPVGLRTLSPSDANYQGEYIGPPLARDRAHHQGSAFPWLLGPLVSSFIKLNGRGEHSKRTAQKMLDGVLEYMREQGIGEICELFDGDTPHRPGGAIASARSIAEVLRAYVEDVLELGPAALPPRPNPAPANPVRTTR
jgi:predicted glycogen debranching enzyme